MHATYLTNLSQANCEQRSESHEQYSRRLTQCLISNVLLYDRVLIGVTDLLCNNVLHRHVFKNDTATRKFLTTSDESGVPIGVVAVDDVPFSEVVRRMEEEGTDTGVEEAELRWRASVLDACQVPRLLFAGEGGASKAERLLILRDRYTEGLLLGFDTLSHIEDDRYSAGIDSGVRSAAARVIAEVEARVADGPLTQSEVFQIISRLGASIEIQQALKRYSDLAYQAAMGRGTSAHLTANDSGDSDFIFATMWSEFRTRLHRLPSPEETRDAEINEALTVEFNLDGVSRMTIEQAVALRNKDSFSRLRTFLYELRCEADPDLEKLEQRLTEHEHVIRIIAEPDKRRAEYNLMRLKRRYKSLRRNAALERLSDLITPAVGAGTGLVGGILASAANSLSPAESLAASVATSVAGTFAPAVVKTYLKGLRAHTNDRNEPPMTENLYRAAIDVAETRHIRR